MKNIFAGSLLLLAFIPFHFTAIAGEFYVSLSGANVAPYADWLNAATNIQDAIDAASAGDTVLVTNGIYAAGGKVVVADLTNRVVLDKALTVQSVNGPLATVISGTGVPNGTTAVRCAWLTNGAVLQGFTIQSGGTRAGGIDAITLNSGGGVWCASTNAIVSNCIIQSNNAASFGSAVYQGTLLNSAVIRNEHGSLTVAYKANLLNCTVVSNNSSGLLQCRCTNTISFFNFIGDSSTVFSYSCSQSAAGPGNLTSNPQLLPDAIHLSNGSPCRQAGTNIAVGSDIDGDTWLTPASMGCDQWESAPLMGGKPVVQLTNDPIGFKITAAVAGQEPFTCWWNHNGITLEDDGHFNATHTTNLVSSGLMISDAGNYHVVISNAFGAITSSVVLVAHYADAASTFPVSPYLDRGTAATNIQDGINASTADEVVFVNDGVYEVGGKIGGGMQSRVVVDKAILVQSINGAGVTMILGSWDSATNGPAAIRCVYVTNRAAISGFTLRGGATLLGTSTPTPDSAGGGVSAASNAVVANCIITGNSAGRNGGGAVGGILLNCVISSNNAPNGVAGAGLIGAGGGASGSTLRNCAILNNTAVAGGGGLSGCKAVNCTITKNFLTSISSSTGCGAASSLLTNCIVYDNGAGNSNPNYSSSGSSLSYCIASPLPAGLGNLNVDPQLLADNLHISETSPCRGAGDAQRTSGRDIDGQTWNNPPAIGCDEWQPMPAVITTPSYQVTGIPLRLIGDVIISGKPPFSSTWYKDGVALEETAHTTSAGGSRLTVRNFGPQDAGDYFAVISNAFGMATSLVSKVVVHCVDAGGAGMATPYSSWSSAAKRIQDAIEVSGAGDFVLVTNGLYTSGGKTMAGTLSNRVALDKALTVSSIGGPRLTIIQGERQAGTTNGPEAMRCAWVGDKATLYGFTLTGGATLNVGSSEGYGGGAFANTANARIANCIITNNAAGYGGGGVYGGQVVNCGISGNRAGTRGGGAYSAALINCTVLNNSAPLSHSGPGAYGGSVTNSILLDNHYAFTSEENYWGDLGIIPIAYSCTTPLPSGPGNIAGPAQILEDFYLSSSSPCRGRGTPLVSSGVDIEGDAWLSPPAMGCDEYEPSSVSGPLAVWLGQLRTESTVGQVHNFLPAFEGRISRYELSFGDNSSSTNGPNYHVWTNAADYVVTLSGFNTDHPDGVSTNLTVHVYPYSEPHFTGAAFVGTNFTLSYGQSPDVNYQIETTTNLTAPVLWTFLYGAVAQSTNDALVIDSRATNEVKFYRVRNF
jgi:hypothetical protein